MEERLESYNAIKAEIKRLKYEIKKLENEEYGISGSNLEITGIKPKGYIQSGAEAKIIDNTNKIQMYKRQIEELELEIEYIDAKLNMLTPLERETISLKYFKQISGSDISPIIERDESTVSRIIKRSLSKMS